MNKNTVKLPWTPEQENAISAVNSSIIVSAAAGSGKTAVLTERLIRFIKDPKSGVRADRIIAVTFAKDAAAELKKRLDKKLSECIKDDPYNTHLVKQQILLQNAKISTINSFCFEIIRDHITEQGITSGFSVMDESYDKVLKSQAMDELIEYYSQNEYDKLSLMYDRFCKKNISGLTGVIESVDRFLSSLAFREEWLDTAVSEYRKDFKNTIYYKSFMEYCISKLNEAVDIAQECLKKVNEAFYNTEVKKYIETIEAIECNINRIKNFRNKFLNGIIPDEDDNNIVKDFCSLSNKRAKDTDYDKELWENAIKELHENYKNIVREVVAIAQEPEITFRMSAEVTEILVEMVRKYQSIIWEKRCAKNSISFDDGERIALEILSEKDENGRIVQSETARRIADFYDIIMIDEYQDSNNKEDMIFKLISKNYHSDKNGNPMYGDNAFIVGDVKQSIYRFRLTNPENFISTLESSEKYIPDSKALNKKIFLNNNFRSSQEVIDFVNYVFSNVMSKKCGDIDYDNDDGEKLHFSATAYSNDGSKRLTHIAFINDIKKENDNSDNDDENRSVRNKKDEINAEAVYTARKIKEMIDSGAEVVNADGTRRRCRPSDFCILVRKNKFIKQYTAELEKQGISAKGKEEKGYLKSQEITVLINLLKIIDNPLLDIPMTAVMTSPMYMFGISEIAYIRSVDNQLPLFSVMQNMINNSADNYDIGLVRKCSEFLESLEGFRLDAVTMTVGELINKIYDTTDFISVMQLYSNGERKRANLRALIQHAKNYEKFVSFEGNGGLSGFLRHIDTAVKKDGDYEQTRASASSGDYVSIMTMHKSKGLEFTFVFIAETYWGSGNDKSAVLCSPDGRIGYKLYESIPEEQKLITYRTFQKELIKNENNRNERSETMRLMYVGLTRAKQKLFINLKVNKKRLDDVRKLIKNYKDDISEQVCKSECFNHWLWLCLMKHSAFADIAQKLDIVQDVSALPEPSCSDRIFEYEFVDGTGIKENAEATIQKEYAVADGNLCSKIKRVIYNEYDSSLSRMPAKYSVTQLTGKSGVNRDFDFKLKRPAFMSDESTLTGAERGTAIHTFFQYCIFENALNNPYDEIKRITDMGYISSAQSEVIDPHKVRAFFESSLYQRIKSSVNVWREKKFMVAVSELDINNDIIEKLRKSDSMIKGIIDLMFEEEDGLVIVDYKSDRGVSEKRLAERYAMQIQLYKSAVELTTGKRVKEAYLYSIEMEKTIPIEL